MIDSKTQFRMEGLAREAVPFSMRLVLYKEPGMFMFLPAHESGTLKFKNAVEDALQHGATPLGSIALMGEATEDGEAVFGYSLLPGASEEAMIRAKALFRDNLIADGVLTMEGAQC